MRPATAFARGFALPVALVPVLLLSGCGGKPAATSATTAYRAPAGAAPTVPAAAPDLKRIGALADTSRECALTYFRSIDFRPGQQQAVLERGKLGELISDSESVASEQFGHMADLVTPGSDSSLAEFRIVALQDAASMDNIRAKAYDAYYESMGAPAQCAPDQAVLDFIGKTR